MKSRVLLCFLVVVFLSACSTKNRLPTAYQAPPENAAFLAGSIGVQLDGKNRSKNALGTLIFRQVGRKENGLIQVGLGGLFHRSPVHYQKPEMRGRVFSLPLEPGDYEFVCTFPGHHILMRGVMKVEK